MKGERKALFLDLDGTVRRTLVANQPCPRRPEEQEVLPGRREKIWEYKKAGHLIFAVTNQGGVGLGLMTADDCLDCLIDLNKKLDGVFDDMIFAGAPPDKKDMYTKPNPGMITTLAHRHKVDLANSLMVGDMETDELAAARAGVPFKYAKEFFK